MVFKEIAPGSHLASYIKAFYFYESASASPFDDIVFPSGNMEMIFNLGEGQWQIKKNNVFYTNPGIEFWGQITRPLPIRSIGKNIMLGIRFYPHSAAYFFKEDIADLNNEIVDAFNVFGDSVSYLHEQLLSTSDLGERVALLEKYLLQRLSISERLHHKIKFVGQIADSLKFTGDNQNISAVSIRNNISTRYLNQLFSQYTGLAPKMFYKINRFQHSLTLVNNKTDKLTGIAYDAGYFDQSHFIREFKLFTGITPTSFSSMTLPINQVLALN